MIKSGAFYASTIYDSTFFILFFTSCELCQAQVRPTWAPEETEERVVPAF